MRTPELAIEIEGEPNPESDAFVFWSNRRSRSQKIFPALQNMARHGTLKVPVIGVAKSG
jgi:glucose-6-phosphate 1-dehydrogenase